MVKFENVINRLSLLYLFLFPSFGFCQGSFISNTIYRINSSNLVKESGLSEYDIWFLGEAHESLNLSNAQFLLIEKLVHRSKQTKIMLETPVSYNEILNGLCYSLTLDTTIYKFAYFSETPQNVEFPSFIRKLYLYNNNRQLNQRIKLVAIDETDLTLINKDDILNFYDISYVNKVIRKDLKIIHKIKNRYSKEKQEYHYLKFYNQLKIHKQDHIDLLGNENYKRLYQILKGLEIYKISIKDTTIVYYKSPLREEFMFENMSNEVINDSMNYISVNGHFHIPLNIPDEWVGVKNWESLAYKVKKAYPQKKVCSIYFMNRQDDYLSDRYFPKEKQMILENTKPGETYLIRLDGENTPFKELSEKFQYIVVW